MRKITLDPVTRISGLLSIEVNIENKKIIDAKVIGNQFRGFEKMFQGRYPLDMIYLTPRLCGICSTHHALASTLALENALNLKPNINEMIARDITNGFEYLQNNIRQIYFFTMPDYVEMPAINPLFFTDTSHKKFKYRLSKDETNRIKENYISAIKFSMEAHRAIASFAGKAPHPHGVFLGGITNDINLQQKSAAKYAISEIKSFLKNKMLEDVCLIAKHYPEYFSLGKSYGNFMDFGIFNNYNDNNIVYSRPGVLINGVKNDVNLKNITECISNSFFNSTNDYIIPSISEPPTPDRNKENAYSWITSPRYNGYALEGGSLARMTINGYYNNGISSMDRIMTRVLETIKIAESIELLINNLEIAPNTQKEWSIPDEAYGIGTIGASRGCLAHWISIKNGVVDKYSVIPPSNWNLSPTDDNGVKGPVEYALIGTEIKDIESPIEIGRIVRSFDPCSNCAAHITSNSYNPIKINIL